MNARTRLAALYEEWRLMSESEGDAIRSLDWPRVEHCQQVKVQLRASIVDTVSGAGSDSGAAEELRRRFRPVLEHLISLENRNNEWLAAGRRKLEVERDELNRSQLKLRQVQVSYGAGAGRP